MSLRFIEATFFIMRNIKYYECLSFRINMSKNANLQKANNLYLAHNLLNLGFYIYFILRMFNVADMGNFTQDIGLPVILVLVLALNLIRSHAKKISGGAENPLKKIHSAKILSFAASGLFLGGILLAVIADPQAIWVSVLCVPTYAIAIYVTLKTVQINETDIIDDVFDEEELT